MGTGVRSNNRSSPTAINMVCIALAIYAVPGFCAAGQASTLFRVTVQLPTASPAPGGGSDPGGSVATCRANESMGIVECVGRPAIVAPVAGPIAVESPIAPFTPTGFAAVPIALPSPPNPANPLNYAVSATQLSRQWQAIATGSYRTTPGIVGNPVVLVPELGLFGLLSSVSETRLVSWSGRDYLELTLSW